MVDINLNAKLEITPTERNKLNRKIKKVVNAKISKFVGILSSRISNIALDLTREVSKQPVTGFIKGQGRGELGVIDPDNVINRMLLAMVSSSSAKRIGNAGVDFTIGRTASMRTASRFVWTTSKRTTGYIVNLYSLIQNEPIPNAGWDGTGVPNAAFIKIGGRRLEGGKVPPIDLSKFSRTGEGLMIGLSRTSARPYRLPIRHIKGFSRFLQGREGIVFINILDKYVKESLAAVGIKVPSGRLLRFRG